MSTLTSTTMQAQNMISRKFPSMSTASKKYTLLKSVKRMALKYWRRVLRTTLKITAKKKKIIGVTAIQVLRENYIVYSAYMLYLNTLAPYTKEMTVTTSTEWIIHSNSLVSKSSEGTTPT